MNFSAPIIDVTFETPSITELLPGLKHGDSLSAARLLTVCGGESEGALEGIFDQLRQLDVTLDLSDLPRVAGDTETALRLKKELRIAQSGDLLNQLEETDPLKMYLQEIAGIPAFGDVAVLAEELHQANLIGREDTPARSALLNLFLNRVVELACEYAGQNVLLMDLIQEGSMGLWESLPYYDGADFYAFADHWIRWYMAKAVVTQAYASGVGTKLRQAMEDFRAVDEQLLTELGRNPTVEEIAQALHMSVSETEAVQEMLESAQLLRRAKTPMQEEIPQEEDQAVEDTAYFQMRQRIQELLSILPDLDAKLLSLRYGLEGGIPMKPEQVAQKLQITVEDVMNREAAALSKLRNNKE